MDMHINRLPIRKEIKIMEAELGKCDRQTRHASCIEATNLIRAEVGALEDLKDEILGQNSIKSDAEKKPKEPNPSLSAFLEEAPEKLRVLADRIRESIDGIRKGIL